MSMEIRELVAALQGSRPDSCEACDNDGIQFIRCGRGDCSWERNIRLAAADEIENLRMSVIAFAAPWATNYAQEDGYPDGYIYSVHYDLLKKMGARMDDFVRVDYGDAHD